MGANVDLYCGPAGTGKTARLLAMYAEELERSAANRQFNRTLWLSPTVDSRNQTLRSLCREQGQTFFAPNVLTFAQFAERILASANENVRPLREAGKRILLHDIISRLHHNGQLNYFGRIAHTPGMTDLVVSFISELKREEIWPEHFLAACEQQGLQSKDRELLAIYEEYQRVLNELALYDAEGQFWWARTALVEGRSPWASQLQFVVLDGFTDLTRPQHDIVASLAHTANQLLITLPLEQPIERTDLFAKSENLRSRLNDLARVGCELREHFLDPNSGVSGEFPAIEHLARRIFSNPREVVTSDDAAGIEIIEAIGQRAEVRFLAERTKQLLLEGVSPEQIVIGIRRIDDYAAQIEELFSAANIPFSCEVETPLARTPLIKAINSFLDLEESDWEFDRLMRVLDSNYFHPQWPEYENGEAVRAVSRQLRRIKASSGRSNVLRKLQRRAERNENAEHSFIDPTVAKEIEQALKLLSRYAETTNSLRHQHDFAGWSDLLLSLSREFGIAPRSETTSAEMETAEEFNSRDVNTWDLFARNLTEAARLQAVISPEPRLLSFGEFTEQLRDLLQTESIPATTTKHGCVRILPAAQIRNLDIDHLLLAGLVEASFPEVRGDDCLYNEAERETLNKNGLSLRQRSMQAQDEMLLFYGIVTRSRKSLVLSYPCVNSKGQPLFPSPYLNSLGELFDSSSLQPRREGRLDPVPSREQLLTATDFRIAATNEAVHGEPELLRTLVEHEATRETGRNILASAQTAGARYHASGLTIYDGMIENPRNIRRLAQSYPPHYEFSATQLEQYAKCPFQFFAAQVLNLTELESPELSTDFRRRGIVIHDVLAGLYREAIADVSPDGVLTGDSFADLFREVLDERFGRHIGDSELERVLGEIEQTMLAEWADVHAEQWSEYANSFGETWSTPPMPTLFEVGFGHMKDEEEQPEFECITFGNDEEVIRVQGRIDRIDVGSFDGRNVFNIIDYKTGGLPTFNQQRLEAGKSLQLAIYAFAAKRLALVGPDSEPFQMGYWGVRDVGFTPGLKQGRRKANQPIEAAVLDAIDQSLDEVIPKLVGGIRNGDFPLDPSDAECHQRCEFHSLCRIRLLRPMAELLDKQPTFR